MRVKRILTLFIITCLAFTSCTHKKIKNDNFLLTTSIESNNIRNTFVSEDKDFIYILEQLKRIKKLSKNDHSLSQIFSLDENSLEVITSFECFENKVYILTNYNRLISIDKYGQNFSQFEFGNNENTINTSNSSSYLIGDNLYFTINGKVYCVTENPLSLDLYTDDIFFRPIANTECSLDTNEGNIYLLDSSGSQMLLSSTDETVISTNLTDYYIFYVAIPKELSEICVYRMNLDGSDKKLIKNMSFENLKNITFDNKYIYICAGNGYVKIDKETFDEINLSNISELSTGYYEVVDEKFFQCLLYPTYYIDTRTGEKIFIECN